MKINGERPLAKCGRDCAAVARASLRGKKLEARDDKSGEHERGGMAPLGWRGRGTWKLNASEIELTSSSSVMEPRQLPSGGETCVT